MAASLQRRKFAGSSRFQPNKKCFNVAVTHEQAWPLMRRASRFIEGRNSAEIKPEILVTATEL